MTSPGVMAPRPAWLRELRAELGSAAAVAELLELNHTQACRYLRSEETGGGPKRHITVDLVERCAARAGTTLDAIYEEVRSAA